MLSPSSGALDPSKRAKCRGEVFGRYKVALLTSPLSSSMLWNRTPMEEWTDDAGLFSLVLAEARPEPVAP